MADDTNSMPSMALGRNAPMPIFVLPLFTISDWVRMRRTCKPGAIIWRSPTRDDARPFDHYYWSRREGGVRDEPVNLPPQPTLPGSSLASSGRAGPGPWWEGGVRVGSAEIEQQQGSGLRHESTTGGTLGVFVQIPTIGLVHTSVPTEGNNWYPTLREYVLTRLPAVGSDWYFTYQSWRIPEQARRASLAIQKYPPEALSCPWILTGRR